MSLSPRELQARLDKHEAICAERYENLSRLMEENQSELKALRQLAAQGTGAWKAILMLGTMLTILLTILKLTQKL